MFSTWFKTANFFKSGKHDLRPVIAHQLKLEDFETGFELMKSGNWGKIVMSVLNSLVFERTKI